MSDGEVEFCQKSIWLLFNPSPQKLLFLRCLPYCTATQWGRTNTIHLFAKKCVRRVLNLLSGRLSCPYGVLKLLPYILRRKTQGRCHEVTEGLSPTIENSYVVFPNSSPKKIWNKAVGKRFISKIQVYSYEFSTELKKATW